MSSFYSISTTTTLLLFACLNIFQIEGFNPKQNPTNSWIYFGRGLNTREIIDLARPTGIEEELSTNSTAEITTEKLLETTLESRGTTTNGPSTPTVIPTTAAPVAGKKEISNIRNLPETVVNETTSESTSTSSTTTSTKATTTTLKALEKITDLPKKVVVEALTSELPLRAKIVVIPKEILATTTEASEVFGNVTESISSTKVSEILEVVATSAPAKKISTVPETKSSTDSETLISLPKKSSKEEILVSSEETEKSAPSAVNTTAAATIPSLRLILRRIFKGE
uniref:Uncharacterized protein n=1 Tax=Panagrolaimus sp. ES5 TaxID=591445 RepID=A0AC34GST8_9BILA